MGKEEPYIRLWRDLIEQSLGWENSDTWNEYDFEKLSEFIFSKSDIRLSVSTLKRIWGKVQYKNTPATATLNALARALNFDDWRAFKNKIDKKKSADKGFERNEFITLLTNKQSLLLAGAGLTTLLVFLCIIDIFKNAIWNNKNRPVNDAFTSMVISNKLPNSVVFNYNVRSETSNELYLQQSWDPKRTEKLDIRKKQHTSVYYYPGFFSAKLIADKQVRKTTSVFITTLGWTGIIDKSPVPMYLTTNSMLLKDGLGITSPMLERLKGADFFNDTWVHLCNFKYFNGASGHDFKFEAALRNTSGPELSSCRKATIEIVGTTNEILIPLSDKGCTSTLNLSLGSITIYGKDHDLSKFGCDFNSFQHVSCEVLQNRITISLNDTIIFSGVIAEDIGKIVGIEISFEGTGMIHDIKLGNSKKVIYRKAW